MTPRLYINGRFLTPALTGVPRYASCIVRAMDDALATRPATGRAEVVLLAPSGAATFPGLHAISMRQIGPLKGHAWDQLTLAADAADGVLLSLCSAGPLLHPRHIVVVHDASVFRIPENFGGAYRTLHRALDRGYARFSQIATVSRFSRNELSEILKPARPILLTPNAAEHVLAVPPDSTILDRLKLGDAPFFLGLGSVKKNKNFAAAIEALRQGPKGTRLVIVGDRNDKVFGLQGTGLDDRVIWAGRCSDSEIVALMRAAHAFVFPSTYEGFGIPALEAMALGCPVLASTAPAVIETCGAGARYFDPRAPAALAALMQETIDEPEAQRAAWIETARRQAASFSWRASAETLLGAAEALCAAPAPNRQPGPSRPAPGRSL
jgi:glycosyltransferase involved in cell wall biosynthesis